MNIYFLPEPASISNPYLSELQKKLLERKVPVSTDFDGYLNVKQILSKRPSIYHFHWLIYHYYRKSIIATVWRCIKFVLKLLLIKATKSRIVWTIHNYMPHDSKYPRIDYFVRWLFARIADTILCHSTEGKDFLSVHFNRHKDVYLLPHPNFIGIYPDTISRKEARARLKIPQDAFVFLALGTIRPYKNTTELVSAFKQLSNENAVLLVAGVVPDKTLEHTIKQEIASDHRIRFIPEEISPANIQLFFRASDISVFTFKNMLTSGSVLLSMSFKTPVIIPRFCKELSTNMDFGFVYSDEKLPALLECMKKSISSDVTTLGLNGYNRALKSSWDEYADKLIELYERLM